MYKKKSSKEEVGMLEKRQFREYRCESWTAEIARKRTEKFWNVMLQKNAKSEMEKHNEKKGSGIKTFYKTQRIVKGHF